ncbi:MAG: FadR/GntR family transcriptional regulator [Pseudomonadota bacterium]
MKSMFETIKPNRISETIVEQIRKAILQGDLKIGDRLPSEKDLAQSFGVSKSSLREAYRVLEAYGLLEIRQGMSGGAFVKEVDLKTIKDSLVNYFFFQNPSIREYTQVRTFIEPEIVKICAAKITDQDIRELENNIVEMEKEPEGESFLSDLDSAFHKKLVDIAGNSILSLVVESVQTALINIKRLLHTDEAFLLMVCKGHKEIVSALSERNPDRASQVMLKHIIDVEQGMLACRNGAMVLTESGVLTPENRR